ncbi:MAG TPA: hypothetical protein PK902_02800 [Actinomycetota bacterium]|nr:hypothetical protein [Actinomycetota bacterium]
MADQETQPVESHAVDRSRWRPLSLLLLALFGYLVVRGTVMLNGYLYADDFALRYWADTSGLTPEYLFRSYYGHVQPWGLLAQWILQAGWPGSWTALMVWALLMQIAILALLWRIVLRLTGSQVAAFLAFLVPALSSFTFEVGVWWCMIIESAPYGLFMMVAIWALIRALSGDPGRWWLWSGLAYCAALLSISKGVFFLLIMVIVAAFLPIAAAKPRGLRAAFRTNPRYWTLIAGFTMVYALFLQVHAPISRSPDWDLLRALRYSRDLFLLNIVNGSAGGPWQWFSAQGETWNGVLVIPRHSALLLVVAVALLASVVIVVRRYRPVLFGYLMGMVVYALALTALAAYGRGGAAVASSGYRYTSDFWILLALFAGLLFYPTLTEVDPFSERVKALRARGITRQSVAVGAAVAFIVSSLISSVEPSLRWVNSQTKEYVTVARESMPSIPETAEFLPQKTMTDLIHPMLMLPFASTEVVFSPDPAFRPFVEYSTDGLFGFANDGTAQQQFVAGTPSQPNGVCGYQVSATPVVIPMSKEVPQWSFVAQVSYLSDADTTVRMVIGPNTHEVPIRQGLHNVFFEVEGPVPDVTVTGTDPRVQTCIDLVSIGPRLGPDNPEPFYPPPEWPQ